ncbi:unnamed protein product, partial [Ascophyllum nodosum]
SDHDSHEHGEYFKQAAVYNMTAGNNNLIVVPGGDATSFVEDVFAFMVMPAATADDEDGLEQAEETAVAAWEAFHEGIANATVLATGEAASPSVSTVYEVALEDSLAQVLVIIDTERAYALFVEHGSDEEGDHEDHDEDHHVDHGNEDEEGVSPATAAQWGNAIVASLVISLCSLAGIITVASGCISNKINISHAGIFAAGALLAASLLHIIPESLEGLESDFDDLHEMGIAAGTAILGGISLGVVLHAFVATGHTHAIPVATPTSPTTDQNDNSTGNSANYNTETLQALIMDRGDRALTDVKGLKPVCWNLIIGDFVHNFADGIIIGAAFLGCSPTIGWTVTASTVLHEIPHEIADFMALINGGMSMMQAIVFNLISALSAVLGAVIILALREALTTADVSYILLVGAGSFFFIALAELIPEGLVPPPLAKTRQLISRSQALKLLTFLAGALIIGIPLIFDQHCEDGHHGHDH